MKKKYLTLVALATLSSVLAQEQNVVSSAGEIYNNGSSSIEFTIGEGVISTETDGTNVLTQGFHQTKLSVVAVKEIDTDIQISVFPNPVINQLSIQVDKLEGLNLQIYSLEGKLLVETRIEKLSTALDVSDYPAGTYLMKISSKNEFIKSYKIIKQ